MSCPEGRFPWALPHNEIRDLIDGQRNLVCDPFQLVQYAAMIIVSGSWYCQIPVVVTYSLLIVRKMLSNKENWKQISSKKITRHIPGSFDACVEQQLYYTGLEGVGGHLSD